MRFVILPTSKFNRLDKDHRPDIICLGFSENAICETLKLRPFIRVCRRDDLDGLIWQHALRRRDQTEVRSTREEVDPQHALITRCRHRPFAIFAKMASRVKSD